MKSWNLCAFVLIAVLCAHPIWAQHFFDDFEGYESGQLVSALGDTEWELWDANIIADSSISDSQAFSGDNSLVLEGDADIVKVFRDILDGMWVVSAQAYVSSDQTGTTYFILLNTYNHGGPYNWSVQLEMNPTIGTMSHYETGKSLPLVVDDWAEIKVVIDLDNDTHAIYYGGELLSEGGSFQTDGQLALECIDLYSASESGAKINETFMDDVSVSKVCVPVNVARTVDTEDVIILEGEPYPFYKEGEDLYVTLDLTNARAAGNDCPDLDTVTITETLPDGWTATEISDDGTFADGKVTWVLAPDAVDDISLTYEAAGPAKFATIDIVGAIDEEGNPFTLPVTGNAIFTENGLRSDGVIASWLLLGPYKHRAGGTTPASLMRRDHLTDDEEIFEEDIMPVAGDVVETAYYPEGGAASSGLETSIAPDINPEGLPQWYAWREKDENVDLDALHGPIDKVMSYAVCYIKAEEDMTVTLRAGSDDTLQVLHDDQEVWLHEVDRGWTGFVDVFEVNLHAGVNRIMCKVFENGGGWSFGVKITDAEGLPITEGITVTLDPGEVGPDTSTIYTGDVNNDGSVNLADAISLLTHLFVTKGLPCLKGADANDDDKLDLADAISILTYQFQNGTMIGPDGSDITTDNIGCHEYPLTDVEALTCENPCE